MDDDEARPFAAAGNAEALLRGSLVHRLLQSLPDIPAARRAKAANDYLARTGADFSAEERKRLAEQVMLLLDDPLFSELFGPGSRAEVPIVGWAEIRGEKRRVSGQVDRLAVTQASVLIGDFKTNRPPPRQSRTCRSLRPPARALPRRAHEVIPGQTRPRRPDLDGSA